MAPRLNDLGEAHSGVGNQFRPSEEDSARSPSSFRPANRPWRGPPRCTLGATRRRWGLCPDPTRVPVPATLERSPQQLGEEDQAIIFVMMAQITTLFALPPSPVLAGSSPLPVVRSSSADPLTGVPIRSAALGDVCQQRCRHARPKDINFMPATPLNGSRHPAPAWLYRLELEASWIVSSPL